MEIKLIEDRTSTLEVQIRYPSMSLQVQQLIRRIQSVDLKIVGNEEGRDTILNAFDVFYIESIDRKTFLYTKDQVYRTSKKLYQYIEELNGAGFIQISKSCLLNMEVLDSVRTLFNSRLEATLTNGEKVIITRTYIPAVKEWLDGEAEQ
ncbi:MAG TPA: LytTR family DNA-binding domain-containing protein [Lachnospiraceae bacterium]|nr:LytTR family DNA-binding domain-containing protein [Lachnospiraceae bacterium]